MTKLELYCNFVNNIENERQRLGYSQKKMAEAIDMSLSTYKSMIRGDYVNVNMYSMYLAYQITGRLASELTQESVDELELLTSFRALPAYKKKNLVKVLAIERELADNDFKNFQSDTTNSVCSKPALTTCFIPTGNMEDGMLMDSTSTETIDISRYVKFCPESIDCAIKITSNHLHPVYHLDDVLLVHQSAPRDGDTGIFINKNTHRIYIRRFRQTNPCQLIPINGIGQTITVDSYNPSDMNQWIKFGKVMMKCHL